MPNWAENLLILEHQDPAQIKAVRQAIEKGDFFNSIKPKPNFGDNPEANKVAFGYEGWFDFCCAEWGTKWDINKQYCHFQDETEKTLAIVFETAWSPPLGIYQELHKRGFRVEAFWFEEAEGFCGQFFNGLHAHYNLPESAESARQFIPERVLEEMAILERVYDENM
jgi:hypothetical protein